MYTASSAIAAMLPTSASSSRASTASTEQVPCRTGTGSGWRTMSAGSRRVSNSLGRVPLKRALRRRTASTTPGPGVQSPIKAVQVQVHKQERGGTYGANGSHFSKACHVVVHRCPEKHPAGS